MVCFLIVCVCCFVDIPFIEFDFAKLHFYFLFDKFFSVNFQGGGNWLCISVL